MNPKQLKHLNRILLICAAVCLLCYDHFRGLWLKGFTSSWFVLLGGVNLWAARKADRNRLRFFLLMEAGLFCGMCADVLLGITFLAGVLVFALGHVLYFAAFCHLEKFSLRDLGIIIPLALAAIYVVVGTPWITVEEPLMTKLLLGYAVIISGMLGKAISNLLRSPDPCRWLLAIASLLFWFSDLMLAVNMFGHASRLFWILCSYSYWPAQNLLAHALFHAPLKERKQHV